MTKKKAKEEANKIVERHNQAKLWYHHAIFEVEAKIDLLEEMACYTELDIYAIIKRQKAILRELKKI